MELRSICNPLRHLPVLSNCSHQIKSSRIRSFSVRSCRLDPNESHKLQLVLEVKEKLEKDYQSLPVGKNGRDDEDMILWFLKDRKFSVEDAVERLNKAIKWRREFRVSELSQDSVKCIAETGKAYVHDFLDVNGRPVLIVDASKHLPAFDVFYYYYPKRLGQVLFVGAPFIFKPIWQLAKPLLKSYSSLVRFCSVETVRKEYFTEATVPAKFRD
ncbi:phosphatidylinositol/phosphatidylcholine transfer protein SFH3-like isoform X3 [Malus sylvestris]|uniref:phosphatidylinositol/phosphatidylcholine transfer protein SFH3-like isoform X3 n=1 Tax=Malus sylvestris TaxID=3752 RepID=UPI0021ABBCF3|nr:phosphatidylinositol/phosphatidylcholine transfer protein SFH3-like isoform X3 [Malus sylvestris]